MGSLLDLAGNLQKFEQCLEDLILDLLWCCGLQRMLRFAEREMGQRVCDFRYIEIRGFYIGRAAQI